MTPLRRKRPVALAPAAPRQLAGPGQRPDPALVVLWIVTLGGTLALSLLIYFLLVVSPSA